MAVALECIDFIVPIDTIRRKYPGGWEKCLEDHRELIGGRVWYDDYLFRDGGMAPWVIGEFVDHWNAMGFETYALENGQRVWRDACVVESLLAGPTCPCDWIEMDWERRAAYLAGTEPGEVVSRDSFRRPAK